MTKEKKLSPYISDGELAMERKKILGTLAKDITIYAGQRS